MTGDQEQAVVGKLFEKLTRAPLIMFRCIKMKENLNHYLEKSGSWTNGQGCGETLQSCLYGGITLSYLPRVHMFSTDIVGRRTCSHAVLFYVVYSSIHIQAPDPYCLMKGYFQRQPKGEDIQVDLFISLFPSGWKMLLLLTVITCTHPWFWLISAFRNNWSLFQWSLSVISHTNKGDSTLYLIQFWFGEMMTGDRPARVNGGKQWLSLFMWDS